MLSKRLSLIFDIIKNCDTLLDVGCDHGYLVIEAVKSGKAKRGIAADIRPGPLASAGKNIKIAGLSEKISLRRGDGISVISKGEADIVVIAGMGGMMIRDILKNNSDIAKSVKKFILQPMNCQNDLREFLENEGYSIESENIVFDKGKFYSVITTVPKGKPTAEREIMRYTGNLTKADRTDRETLVAYLDYTDNKFRKIEEGIRKSSGEDGLEKIIKLREELLWLRSEILKN